MNERNDSSAEQVARDYYDSADADLFYRHVWGGEDIHVGLYDAEEESIAKASRRTVAYMAKLAGDLTPSTRVIDLGAGYGGSTRYLARQFGAQCVALNLSEVENKRNRRMTHDAGLDDRVDVVQGDFAALDFPDESFDIAWSQEALLHSGSREQVCAEVARVLRPGGRFLFTDPMKTDDAETETMQAILDRLDLASLASPAFYRTTFSELGMKELTYEARPQQLINHYDRVRQVLVDQADLLSSKGVSHDWIEGMKSGLRHWVEGGRQGVLTWGIFVFEKR